MTKKEVALGFAGGAALVAGVLIILFVLEQALKSAFG